MHDKAFVLLLLCGVRPKLKAVGFNHFAPIVITAISTDPMRYFLLPAVGALVKGGLTQLPIGTAFSGARM